MSLSELHETNMLATGAAWKLADNFSSLPDNIKSLLAASKSSFQANNLLNEPSKTSSHLTSMSSLDTFGHETITATLASNAKCGLHATADHISSLLSAINLQSSIQHYPYFNHANSSTEASAMLQTNSLWYTNGKPELPLTSFCSTYIEQPMRKIDQLIDYYITDIWRQGGDKRTSSLPFMASPWKLILATLFYLYAVKICLPKLMKNSRPLELKNVIRSYNLLMIMSNLYAFYHGCRIFNFGLSTFGCEIINEKDTSAKSLELLAYGYMFLISRIVEWLDTIFFVLRKKDSQVTKLHVFHHAFVPNLVWVYLKYHPGASVGFFPFVNSFVHIVMYFYYFLSSFGAKVQPYLWWKKYLTSMQITQFVLILIQNLSIFMTTGESCQYPRTFLYCSFLGAITFLWLFYSYYIDTYKSTTNIKNNTNPTRYKQINKKKLPEGYSTALQDTLENVIGYEAEDCKLK